MHIPLTNKVVLKGFSRLHNVHYSRIKAIARKPCNSIHSEAIDRIRMEKGGYCCEYRIVKEKKGFIFREVLEDTGISGHHPTVKTCLKSALFHVDIYIDEPFAYAHLFKFKQLEKEHQLRTGKTKNYG